ncbi:MAG: hypothetical protein ABGZ35_31125 [Planctomycetaceae bacterium]
MMVNGTPGDDHIYFLVGGSTGNEWLSNSMDSTTIPLNKLTSIVVNAGSGNDRVDGWDGSEYGWDGINQLHGGSGDDVLTGTAHVDWIYGDGDNDYLDGLEGDDILRGGSGDDHLDGGTGDDQLHGSSGEDFLGGGGGDDTLYGGSDDDNLSSSEGNDNLYGEGGNGTLHGSVGSNQLFGSDGDDNFFSAISEIGAGQNLLIGDMGNDIYWISLNNLLGNFGYEIVEQEGAGNFDQILIVTGGVDVDVDLSGLNPIVRYRDTGDVIVNGSGAEIEAVFTGTGSHKITGNDYDNVIETYSEIDWETGNPLGPGDDWIDGRGGNDNIYSDYGDDIILGGDGDNIIDGGGGDDVIIGDGLTLSSTDLEYFFRKLARRNIACVNTNEPSRNWR